VTNNHRSLQPKNKAIITIALRTRVFYFRKNYKILCAQVELSLSLSSHNSTTNLAQICSINYFNSSCWAQVQDKFCVEPAYQIADPNYQLSTLRTTGSWWVPKLDTVFESVFEVAQPPCKRVCEQSCY